ncbi:MAG: hypothetical protein IJ207_05815 [Treponema sp.]|uniref:DUF6796 family protein n=1 Tax=Treponema sp. TaxID=166 RepID=UPI0025D0F359|nr:DUF6796 family protein [Treponema sp.]MBQ9281699.1 hypothetical protein [Treponema sp.]
MDKNKNLALYGIIGAVLYAIADLFLYVGVEIESGNLVSYCHVKEWRLMASMWISVFGSLGLLCGFISLYQLVKKSFGEKLKFIMILPFLACGGILYCHFVLGVYNPLTYQSGIKAGISENQIVQTLESASLYLNPLTMAIVLCGYITELIVFAGVLSGKFGLKKRFLLFMYLGYAIFYAFVILLVKLTGITGLRGGLESLFETTFFLPAFFAWKKEQ